MLGSKLKNFNHKLKTHSATPTRVPNFSNFYFMHQVEISLQTIIVYKTVKNLS